MKYYTDQLNRLENSEYNKSIILSDGLGNKTNNLGLNLESIDILIEFLEKEKTRLAIIEGDQSNEQN